MSSSCLLSFHRKLSENHQKQNGFCGWLANIGGREKRFIVKLATDVPFQSDCFNVFIIKYNLIIRFAFNKVGGEFLFEKLYSLRCFGLGCIFLADGRWNSDDDDDDNIKVEIWRCLGAVQAHIHTHTQASTAQRTHSRRITAMVANIWRKHLNGWKVLFWHFKRPQPL